MKIFNTLYLFAVAILLTGCASGTRSSSQADEAGSPEILSHVFSVSEFLKGSDGETRLVMLPTSETTGVYSIKPIRLFMRTTDNSYISEVLTFELDPEIEAIEGAYHSDGPNAEMILEYQCQTQTADTGSVKRLAFRFSAHEYRYSLQIQEHKALGCLATVPSRLVSDWSSAKSYAPLRDICALYRLSPKIAVGMRRSSAVAGCY